MSCIYILRLDQAGGAAPGNKAFKLRLPLQRARDEGIERIVSFGGAWSNHLHALAATARELGLQSVGLVRGDAALDTAMLRDVQRWGMEVVHLQRSEYRWRNDSDFQAEIASRYAPCLLLPEGGASVEGAMGCAAIAEAICAQLPAPARVVMAVGTGTTLAGTVAALGAGYSVTGISALKGAADLGQRVADLLAQLSPEPAAAWDILHQFHCGGFARVSDDLKRFMWAFEDVHSIPLEPVYTGKMMYALHRLLGEGAWDGAQPIVAVHTGGLQGRRGFPWLDAAD